VLDPAFLNSINNAPVSNLDEGKQTESISPIKTSVEVSELLKEDPKPET
jgi:hypothetical protein